MAAIADTLTPLVAPRYYIGLERRAYLLKADDVVFIGRPDIAVIPHRPQPKPARLPLAEASVLDVDVPMNDKVEDSFLEVHEVATCPYSAHRRHHVRNFRPLNVFSTSWTRQLDDLQA